MNAEEPNKWVMGRHEGGSDYGQDAYTLWPHGIIISGLKPQEARLIGAAPDLLAALEGLLALPADDGTKETAVLRREAKRRARAAVAKARRGKA